MYNVVPSPTAVRTPLRRWYRKAGRDLPWRRTRDPYAILVSEVMLQQTQVSRVIPAYPAFLGRFPTLQALAKAPLADVLRAWSGLGYNRRARDLQRAARACPNGLPQGPSALDALPGIGAYTAGAVACFAHGATAPFADTNIRRVLGRLFAPGRIVDEREAMTLDAAALPRRDPASWHHALMDLGATVCTARTPRCAACPLKALCPSAGRAAVAPPRRQAAFATSDRRVRGAIVRALAATPRGSTAATLTRVVGDPRVSSLARKLVSDGLLTRDGSRYRLAT